MASIWAVLYHNSYQSWVAWWSPLLVFCWHLCHRAFSFQPFFSRQASQLGAALTGLWTSEGCGQLPHISLGVPPPAVSVSLCKKEHKELHEVFFLLWESQMMPAMYDSDMLSKDVYTFKTRILDCILNPQPWSTSPLWTEAYCYIKGTLHLSYKNGIDHQLNVICDIVLMSQINLDLKDSLCVVSSWPFPNIYDPFLKCLWWSIHSGYTKQE